jgi:bacillithiol biosynthesis cysteine-adding enzyme BshC
MKVTHIPFQETRFFSKTITDYLEKKESIQPFYHNFPNITGFYHQIEEKQQSFTPNTRKVLVDALKNQYKKFKISDKTKENIEILKKQNSFTVTTGHQLNLFTGPLYFLYKIISTVNLCEELTEKFPKQHFVPIYWMASEDHDFDEINYFNFEGKKVAWNKKNGGAVGRFSTDGLEAVFKAFANQLGNSMNAEFLKKLFSEAYLKHQNLAEATRYIVNELFSETGLVIIDGDDLKLKELFSPIIKDELENQTSFNAVLKTISALKETYKIQVNPRELNLFYVGDNYRERIILENGVYSVNNSQIKFSKAEILKEVDNNPLAFSPNVIMRPLYQELVLPNICYIGGAGEIAYWLELKEYFKETETPFPILLLRNSVQLITKKQQKKLNNLKISYKDLFLDQHQLLSKKVIENSQIKIDFSEKINFLKNQFSELKQVAKNTDTSFVGAVKAQEIKQIRGLENLQKRLLRAEKRRQKELVSRIKDLQNQLLPNQGLEERQRNFSEYYAAYGPTFIKALQGALKPLQLEFTVLELE